MSVNSGSHIEPPPAATNDSGQPAGTADATTALQPHPRFGYTALFGSSELVE
jgi:hypothetical protein